MNRFFIKITIGTILISLTSAPIQAIAQTSSTNQVLQRFNPSATAQSSGRTFSGISFSGVGGAVAGCTNLGGAISGGIGSIAGIFKNKTPTVANTPIQSGTLNNANNIASSTASGASSPAATLPGTRDLSTPSIGVSNTQNSISSNLGSAVDQSVPVSAKKTDDELKKANQRESCLNGVAYAVAKGLLRQITDKTLNWVNTGFEGNPLYVRDINSFFKTISDQQVSRFLDDIPNRDPIFGTAIRSIVTEQVSGLQDGLISTVMDTPEARAYQDFQQDFTSGGWAAFLDPQYNAVDAIFNAGEDLSRSIENQTQNVKDQLQRNEGFLDLRRCVESKESDYPYLYKDVACSSDLQTQYLNKYSECVRAGNGTTVSCATSAESSLSAKVRTSCVTTDRANALLNSGESCLTWETVTPGSIIAKQVSEVTTSPIRQLEQADQINEVLGAFFDQLLNRLISNGLGSLRGRSTGTFTFSGAGSNTVIGSSGGTLSNIQYGVNALGYQQAGSGYNDEFDVSRPQHIRAVLQVQYDYLNRLRDARSALNQIVPTLGALDYCIPGPNPTWKEGLNENVSAFFSNLQVVEKNSTLAGRILRSLPILGGIFGADKPDSFAAVDFPLLDKVTDTSIAFPHAVVFRANNRSLEFIFNNIQWRWEELLLDYNTNFTFDRIANAFAAADPGNPAFARGFTASAFEETALLPKYAAASFEIDAYYEESEQQTIDAIQQLEAIRSEANQIVAAARSRHIAQQASLGTPVNLSCLNEAYVINTNPITPVARQESSAVSPLFNQFIEANNYFYKNL